MTLIPTCIKALETTVTVLTPAAPVRVTPVAPAFALVQPVNDVEEIPV
jgi:hypothetical protein